MNRSSFDRAATRCTVLVCVAATGFLGGCVENAKTIREAQAEFSRAAQIENRSLLGAEQGVQASTEAATNYRMVATTLQKLVAEKSGALKKDNLLCTAMALEALSWWRLGDYTTALQISDNSASCSDSSVPAGSQPARDLALFRALPGLILIDQANQKASNPAQTVAQFNEIMSMLTSADQKIETARTDIGPGNPLQLYLIQSQLAIVRNWQFAIYKENLIRDLLICETGHARQQSVKLLSELACASLGVPGDQSSQQLLAYWEGITGYQFNPANEPPDPAVLSSPPGSVTQPACAHLEVKGGFPDSCPRP